MEGQKGGALFEGNDQVVHCRRCARRSGRGLRSGRGDDFGFADHGVAAACIVGLQAWRVAASSRESHILWITEEDAEDDLVGRCSHSTARSGGGYGERCAGLRSVPVYIRKPARQTRDFPNMAVNISRTAGLAGNRRRARAGGRDIVDALRAVAAAERR